ncbi:hypothetical protein PBT90_03500 [Algoriphagus halophytocola]|uniref:hypothetical protein n=1 Tax=Algoriphagus halophytocola TaxID=2991499 RepID=UPI0022DE13DB|nr:hypothetical protein [Algoriphagus sp. TR-M9]WBL43753.1 hypothetical protein PBT90_03500 [Algoriphagus sp. TR-M9]
MKKRLIQLSGISMIVLISLIFVDMRSDDLEPMSISSVIIQNANAYQDPIYVACPGTEVALNHPQQYYHYEIGPLGIPRRVDTFICEDGGWCCPMEWA